MESETVLMEIHLSEARLTNGITNDGDIIPAGSRTICHAESKIITADDKTLQNIHTKLDTCGSVSIAHSLYLTQVKSAAEHGLPQIRLTGIGGKSGILNRVGIVQLRTPEGRVKQIQCYVFDSPLGPTQKILLLSFQSVIEASINIIHHMDLSVKGKRGPLRFWPDNKTLEQICRDISSIDLKPTLHRRMKQQEREIFDFDEVEECSEWEQMTEEQDLVNLAIQYIEAADLVVEEVYMTEIHIYRQTEPSSNGKIK